MSISIALPVGPSKANQEWLGECLESISKQTCRPFCVEIIDDMANVREDFVRSRLNGSCNFRIHKTPWNVGVATAFNFGVAYSQTALVFMVGSDDTIDPLCLEACVDTYKKIPEEKRDYTYYYVGVKYMDTGEEQFQICNAAMVSKSLWKHTGGFPVAAHTAPDAALGSIMLRHPDAGLLCCVSDQRTLYNYRRHEGTDTFRHRAWYDVIIKERNLLTLEWQSPQWGRYE